MHILDNPAWAALTGPHRRFAERVGAAVRYQPDVAPFITVAPGSGPDVWADVAALAGPGEVVTVTGTAPLPPEHWEVVLEAGGVQLLDVALQARPDPEAVRLTAATNTTAIRLYESIGFELRRRTTFRAVRVPSLVGGTA